jgi:hypothetical protein
MAAVGLGTKLVIGMDLARCLSNFEPHDSSQSNREAAWMEIMLCVDESSECDSTLARRIPKRCLFCQVSYCRVRFTNTGQRDFSIVYLDRFEANVILPLFESA